MPLHRLTLILLPLFALSATAHAQAPTTTGEREPSGASRQASAPVPVEVMVGNAYSTANLVLSKPFAPQSHWGVFHQNTLSMFYDDARDGDLAAQTLLTFAPGAGFRLTAGAFYGTAPGVSPTAGIQYVRPGRNWFVLVSPRVNLESDPSYSIFSILRYSRGEIGRPRLYLALQALNAFDARQHIRSYQWTRIGADVRGTQFGLAVNFDEAGPHSRVNASAGVFVRREVF